MGTSWAGIRWMLPRASMSPGRKRYFFALRASSRERSTGGIHLRFDLCGARGTPRDFQVVVALEVEPKLRSFGGALEFLLEFAPLATLPRCRRAGRPRPYLLRLDLGSVLREGLRLPSGSAAARRASQRNPLRDRCAWIQSRAHGSLRQRKPCSRAYTLGVISVRVPLIPLEV